MKENKLGFTLLELLVVVLIIGILAGIALPQYKMVLEKSRMAEAVTVVKAIAQSQQSYYLIHGEYADCLDLDDIDVDLSGKDAVYSKNCVAKKTTHFLYTTNGNVDKTHIALAFHEPRAYYIYVNKYTPTRIRCISYSGYANNIQKELCAQLNAKGTL